MPDLLPPYWRARVVAIEDLEATMNEWVAEGWKIDDYADLGEQDIFGKHLFLLVAWNEAEYGYLESAEDEGEGEEDPSRLRAHEE